MIANSPPQPNAHLQERQLLAVDLVSPKAPPSFMGLVTERIGQVLLWNLRNLAPQEL